MKHVDPDPSPRDDGGTNYKDRSCPETCYARDKDGAPDYACIFLVPVHAWPIEEYECSDPDR